MIGMLRTFPAFPDGHLDDLFFVVAFHGEIGEFGSQVLNDKYAMDH